MFYVLYTHDNNNWSVYYIILKDILSHKGENCYLFRTTRILSSVPLFVTLHVFNVFKDCTGECLQIDMTLYMGYKIIVSITHPPSSSLLS